MVVLTSVVVSFDGFVCLALNFVIGKMAGIAVDVMFVYAVVVTDVVWLRIVLAV